MKVYRSEAKTTIIEPVDADNSVSCHGSCCAPAAPLHSMSDLRRWANMKLYIFALMVFPAFAIAQADIFPEYVEAVARTAQAEQSGATFDRFEIKLKKEPVRAYIVIFESRDMDEEHIEAIIDVGAPKGPGEKEERLKWPMLLILKKGMAERTKLYLKYSAISYSTASDSLIDLAERFKVIDTK